MANVPPSKPSTGSALPTPEMSPVSDTPSPGAADATTALHHLIRRCCEEVGLDPDRDADEVNDAVETPPERECCDSGCDPCVLTIARAASLVRQRRN